MARIENYEDGLLLNVGHRFKILRKDTALDVINAVCRTCRSAGWPDMVKVLIH